nr:NACHT domain-containing protein [Corallococcus sp. AB038B]
MAAVTIEGASVAEDKGDAIDAGEELIDVGLYYGDERRDKARLIHYVQLKHSTRNAHEPWTSSGLKKTIFGFAQRYSQLRRTVPAGHAAERFRFEFTTNRPIDTKLGEVLADLASGEAARHPELQQALIRYSGLDETQARQFFGLFRAVGGEGDLWAQRNLLTQDLAAYLPDADCDSPVQLKELVARKATTEFEHDPSILRHDVLRALKVTEEQLAPAPRLVGEAKGTIPRQQEPELLRALLAAQGPLVIHADGGVGKSVVAARLVTLVPPGSEAVLYDCFGDGRYRSALHFRHRHRDALVQVANELAARGLCHPLIPTAHADPKQYMRAFVGRITQAVGLLRASNREARLVLIIDAADNAEMAAEEQKEPSSFVRDLIRAEFPEGVCVAFTCRTHRREKLKAAPGTQEFELQPFTSLESGSHLRTFYPDATDNEVAEFAFLSSSNPRVQALALSRGLPLQEMIRELGPQPTTVERALGGLLERAIAELKDRAGRIEASQIDLICRGLAVLRPLVPVSVLARLSGVEESAVRSFALDLGRPLLLKGTSLHFLDEPAETWFREQFSPDGPALALFLERLRPLTAQSAYAAAALPQLLLQAGRLDELVALALSGEGLPTENPLERRDVELQRLTFALNACLRLGSYSAAAKLALKVGGECAGEQRQNRFIQSNTDVAAIIMAPDRIEEVVSRRPFSSSWTGAHHAYHAGILSGRDEFTAEASGHLRMANDWLNAWARRPADERKSEEISYDDLTELAIAELRLKGPKASAYFIRRWQPRHVALEVGKQVGRRLIDIGREDQLEALAEAAGNDVWLILGLAAEARAAGRLFPSSVLRRLLRLMSSRHVKLPPSTAMTEEWSVLDAARAAAELGMRVEPSSAHNWATVLGRYLPSAPPFAIVSRFDRDRGPLVRAYTLEAALRGKKLTVHDLAPTNVLKELQEDRGFGRSSDAEALLHEVAPLLPLLTLSAEIACGRAPSDVAGSIEAARTKSAPREDRGQRSTQGTLALVALTWLGILRDAPGDTSSARELFTSWIDKQWKDLETDDVIELCRIAARTAGLESLALSLAGSTFGALDSSREDADTRAILYVKIARAILPVSIAEARACFDRAIEIASRIGDENLDRWAAFLYLARAAADRTNSRPRTAYRLARVAELTREYVERDKHFDWEGSVEALTDLCPSSAIAILSRWRDRRFGNPARLLPAAVYRLVEKGHLPMVAPIAFAGLTGDWDRVSDLHRAVAAEPDQARRNRVAQIGYRYLRVQPGKQEVWSALQALRSSHGLVFPDVDRLAAAARAQPSEDSPENTLGPPAGVKKDSPPDWETVFQDVDLLNPGSLWQAYSRVLAYGVFYPLKEFIREAWARAQIGQRPELIRAIAGWPNFGMFEARDLVDSLPSPLPPSPAVRKELRSALLLACRREPTHVRGRGWSQHWAHARLHSEGIASEQDIAKATLEGFVTQLDALGAAELFQMVDSIAALMSPNDADAALGFGLDLMEGVLKPEDGDGPWRPELQPPQSLAVALAGYVWAGLGSPEASVRWECAHVTRSLVELDWGEILDALLSLEKSRAAEPFVDRRLDFYIWHARQWLLVGLARGAIENPTALRRAVPLLESALRESHVLIREFAAQGLRALVNAGVMLRNNASDLDCPNRPHMAEVVYTSWSKEQDEFFAEQILTDDEKYAFGLDIGPYWLAPLGQVFGLSQQSIEKRVHEAIRRHLCWSRGVTWRDDTRRTWKIFREDETQHSHGSLPRTDDLTAYLAYHAMMHVAAVLLEERSVRRRDTATMDDFHEWLAHYSLSRSYDQWLADRRDPRLVGPPPAPVGSAATAWHWSVTAEYLSQQLLSDDGMLVLWGHWSGGEGDYSETVRIRSAVTSRLGAEALVAALQSAPELGRLALPYADDDTVEQGGLKLKGWVLEGDRSDGLDEADPWASRLQYPGPVPSDDAVSALGLVEQRDGRTWTTGVDGVLRSELWTHRQGYGREMDTIPGVRLSANSTFVKRLLERSDESRLVLSVEIRRQRPRNKESADDAGISPPLFIRYYLLGADGVPHPLIGRP